MVERDPKEDSSQADTRSAKRKKNRPAFTRERQSVWSDLGDGDFRTQINVLNRVKQLHTFFHWALERFAAGNQTCAASAFVDDRGRHRLLEVVRAGRTSAVDQSC